jgi:S1-C subfamily serine protease
MIRAFIGLFALTLLAPCIALAQPAVDRLERRVRELTRDTDESDDAGYLGVIADDRAATGSGVELLEIVADSPAAKAGLEAGDLVTKVNDKPIRTLGDFADALDGQPAGAKLRFTIERQGKPKVAEVTLAARPPAEARRFPKFGRIDGGQLPRTSLLGVRVEPVDPDSPIAAGLPTPQGAYVVRVAEGSPAALAGIPLHAVIVAVDGQEVSEPADLKAMIAATPPGAVIKVDFYSRGKLIERSVRLAEITPEVPLVPGAAVPRAADSDDAKRADRERIEQLEQRIRMLEARLSELERSLGK